MPMNLFKKLFGSTSEKKHVPKQEERGKYMPEPNTPTDEKFMKNFIQNGGKFLYCENEQELQAVFDEIMAENAWYNGSCFCYDNNLKSIFNNFGLTFSNNKDADFFLSDCEYLIADTGAILISSNQIKEKKLINLPDNFIIMATTSQLIETISEGLRGIKIKSKGAIPSNISTIKTFGDKKDGDFMTYGCTSKNLYLLLLEDL
ncbi:MAG: LUD domain-containing protein [Mesonia hippocampi]|uniref:LUD domain-containing protein n=1 Tax=Mesonia hippocampi TaxID=1628250 RepID=UPI003F9BC9FF